MNITTYQLMKFGYSGTLKELTLSISRFMLTNYKKFGDIKVVVVDNQLHYLLTRNQIKLVKSLILPKLTKGKVKLYFSNDMDINNYVSELGKLFGCGTDVITSHLIDLGFITPEYTLPTEHITNGVYITKYTKQRHFKTKITQHGKFEIIIALTNVLN